MLCVAVSRSVSRSFMPCFSNWYHYGPYSEAFRSRSPWCVHQQDLASNRSTKFKSCLKQEVADNPLRSSARHLEFRSGRCITMSLRARSRGGKFDTCRRTIMLWGKLIDLTVGDGDRPERPAIRIRVKQLAGNGIRRCCQGTRPGNGNGTGAVAYFLGVSTGTLRSVETLRT